MTIWAIRSPRWTVKGSLPWLMFGWDRGRPRPALFHANLEPGETLDRDILAHFADAVGQQVLNAQIRVLHVFLLQQTDFGKKFVDFSGNNFLDDIFRFARFESLLDINRLLARHDVLGHALAVDGNRIGSGDMHGQVAEGVRTTQSVCALAERHQVEMPITREVYRVLFQHRPPLDAVTDLMMRSPKSEAEELE